MSDGMGPSPTLISALHGTENLHEGVLKREPPGTQWRGINSVFLHDGTHHMCVFHSHAVS